MKSQEAKERWEKPLAVVPVKRPKKEEGEAGAEEEAENVMPSDPLENGFLHHAQREQERMNERLLKKTYSKRSKQVRPVSSSVDLLRRRALAASPPCLFSRFLALPGGESGG